MTRPTIRLLTAVAGVVALISALTAPSSAAPVKKVFHETLSPTEVPSSGSSTLTFRLTNDTSSSQSFGSAEILVPTGYVVSSAVASPTNFTAGATTTAAGAPIVRVTSTGSSSNGIQPGASLIVTMTVTLSGSNCKATWTTFVKQSNDFSGTGNDFYSPEPAPTTTAGANALAFTTQPGPTTQYDKVMSPAPVVSLLDPCGNPVSTFTGAVSLAAHSADPLGGNTLLPGTPVEAVAGVATFPSLTFTDFGTPDIFLTANAAGYPPVSSRSFSVVQVLVLCEAGKTCTTPTIFDKVISTLVAITAASGTSRDTLTASVKGSASGPCGLLPVAASGPPLGAVVAFDVPNRGKTVVMTLPRSYVNQIPNNGTPFMDICLQVPNVASMFTDKFGQATRFGLLPDCGAPKVTPCITDRRKRSGDEIITFDLPAGDPHASWY